MNKLITLSVVGLTAFGLAGCAPAAQEDTTVEATVVESAAPDVEASNADELTAEGTDVEETAESTDVATAEATGTEDLGQLATSDSTVELLSYLIEEEKLAHDVYTVLYDTYGSKVFGNILESESTHQDQVLGLLDAYGVDDPRSTELGVFNDPELQDLYDQLIAKGMQSAQDAYEVGVMIEEKDIADITAQLATASDADVVSVLEKLRSGSENHLRAFNRQL
jgi:hypothetical protein